MGLHMLEICKFEQVSAYLKLEPSRVCCENLQMPTQQARPVFFEYDGTDGTYVKHRREGTEQRQGTRTALSCKHGYLAVSDEVLLYYLKFTCQVVEFHS